MTASSQYKGREHAQHRLLRHCAGEGLELGPGHSPFPMPFTGASVRYVDRWEPAANKSLFPELGDTADFPEPDIVANLDVERLSAVGDATQDFVIASHVFEHVAEPLGLLADIHRALRPGGTLLLLLPDRRRTFDRDRSPTSLEHLIREHGAGTTTVDDDHVEDFLRGTGTDVDAIPAEHRTAVFDLHRRRSIHVHVWSEREWPPVVLHGIQTLGQRWELLEVLNNDDVADSIEFGMVLRRSTTDLDAETLAGRFQDVLRLLGPGGESWSQPGYRPTGGTSNESDAPLEKRVAVLEAALADALRDSADWRSTAEERAAKLHALAMSPLGPLLRMAWSVREKVRPQV